MNGRFLFDTNIVIALFANDAEVLQRLTDGRDVSIPSIVVGELYYGAYRSERVAQNVRRIDDFAVCNRVVGCDVQTARWYGEIRNGLRGKGQPIPDNDIWMAAIAIQYALPLVTRDEHFTRVDRLEIEVW